MQDHRQRRGDRPSLRRDRKAPPECKAPAAPRGSTQLAPGSKAPPGCRTTGSARRSEQAPIGISATPENRAVSLIAYQYKYICFFCRVRPRQGEPKTLLEGTAGMQDTGSARHAGREQPAQLKTAAHREHETQGPDHPPTAKAGGVLRVYVCFWRAITLERIDIAPPAERERSTEGADGAGQQQAANCRATAESENRGGGETPSRKRKPRARRVAIVHEERRRAMVAHVSYQQAGTDRRQRFCATFLRRQKAKREHRDH